MRALYLVTAYARHEGDIITPWLTESIQHLKQLGVEVEVLAPAYLGSGDAVIDGVRVHRFRYAPRALERLTHDQTTPDRLRDNPSWAALLPGYVMSGSISALRLARSGRFDLLHAFWPLPHGLMALAASRAAGLPLVCTFFGVELTWMQRQLPFLLPLLRAIVRGSTAVTAISSYTCALLARAVPGATPVCLPFGAAVEAPASPPPYTWDGQGTFELLFIGRLVERKGVQVLLHALAQLPPARRIRLAVIGDGPLRAQLERQAAALGLDGRVAFHGFVSPSEKQRYLSGCHALVLPAIMDEKGDREGQGVVLIEAMLHGKPVIASRSGGIVDMVQDGHNGLLVAAGDPGELAAALVTYLDQPARARRMGDAGRTFAQARFAGSAIAAEQARIYRSCLGVRG